MDCWGLGAEGWTDRDRKCWNLADSPKERASCRVVSWQVVVLDLPINPPLTPHQRQVSFRSNRWRNVTVIATHSSIVRGGVEEGRGSGGGGLRFWEPSVSKFLVFDIRPVARSHHDLDMSHHTAPLSNPISSPPLLIRIRDIFTKVYSELRLPLSHVTTSPVRPQRFTLKPKTQNPKLASVASLNSHTLIHTRSECPVFWSPKPYSRRSTP